MQISFGKKFTSANLDSIISRYWEAAKVCPKSETIFFDLTQIEWIALEEITFLFGWFRYLILNEKKIKILLPSYNQSFKTHNMLKSLWGRWQIFSFYYSLLDGQGKLEDYFNVDNSVNAIINNQIAKEERESTSQDNIDDDITVVPFQAITASGYGEISSIDSFVANRIHKPLNLAERVYEVVNRHTNLPARENMLLSKIIANELFLNVIHHSISEEMDETIECYFAISLKRKITKDAIAKTERYKLKLKNQYRYFETNTDFSSITEEIIDKKLDFYLKTVLTSGYQSEKTAEVLPYYKGNDNDEYPYRNETFIEFTFLDFGKGIPATLLNNYSNNIVNDKVRNQLSTWHNQQHIDTKILEYAFLLNSSRHPLDIDIQQQYEVPRGLYYLVDIVRRYNGLLVARSGHGKVVYDFSQQVKEIRDAVRFSEEPNLPKLQGTMISIVIPAEQSFLSKVSKVQPSYINHNFNISRQTFYYSMIDIVNEIEIDLGQKKQRSVSLQEVYYQTFNKLNDILTNHTNSLSTVIIDCMGFNLFPVKHKLLHFFASSPYVNSVTNVVILNFNDGDIIEDVRNSIAYKLKNSIDSNFLYKPLPIINSNERIHWIGVLNENDEAKLNELLRYEDHFITTSDLTLHKIYEGSFLQTDRHGNIRSSVTINKNILKYLNNKNED